MSYSGGGSNPPWQRNSLGNTSIQSFQSQPQISLSNTVGYQGTTATAYNQNIGMNQQGNLSLLSSMGTSNINQINTNQMFNQAVAYLSTRDGLNPYAFSPSNQNEGTLMNNNTDNINFKKIVGVVTKIKNDCGFVDEEIFFYKNVCKGTLPKIGDQVLVEAVYNSTSAFKWHATRIQLITSLTDGDKIVSGYGDYSSNSNQLQRSDSGYNNYSGWRVIESSGQHNRNISPVHRSLNRLGDGRNRESRYDGNNDRRRQDEREKDKDMFRDNHGRSIDKGERSSNRYTSPVGRRHRNRGIARYNVQIPKDSLNMLNADLLELRRRYSNLYIPSDFFFTQIRWCDSFPTNAPFSLQKPCSFHIMPKNVESIKENNTYLEPSDADPAFSAKVMLMGIPPISEVYRKCFATAEEKDQDDGRGYIHPTRLINFLVGIRGKDEAIAIGGPWSPSMDGPNPESDPSVLIRTAIRTCKALTGIDLSPCTQWYRFVELYYHRSESTHKGRTIPAHIKTVVIYLPDIRSCVPTRTEWDSLHSSYKQKMEDVIKQSNSKIITSSGNKCKSAVDVADGNGKHSRQKYNSNNTDGDGAIDGTSDGSTNSDAIDNSNKDDIAKDITTDGVDNLIEKGNNSDNNNSSSSVADPDAVGINDKDEDTSIIRERTHYSDLDPKTMKVSDLRNELEARNLSSKGLKPQLIARLTKVLNVEKTDTNLMDQNDDEEEKLKEEENNITVEGGDIDMTDILVIDEYDSTTDAKSKEEISKPMSERERQLIVKHYQLPERPNIIVHPSRTAKNGKFNCDVVSLSLLLDYSPEDSKEHCFEVSLFAELFNEMLMRDFAFNIYKALYALPDKPKDKSIDEEEREKQKDKDKEKGKEKEKEKDNEKGIKKRKKEDDKSKEKKVKIDENYESKHSQNTTTNDKIENANKSKDYKERVHKQIDTEKEKDYKDTEKLVKDQDKDKEKLKEKEQEKKNEKEKEREKEKDKENEKEKEKEQEKEKDMENENENEKEQEKENEKAKVKDKEKANDKEKEKEKERDTKDSKDRKRKRREDESDDDTRSVQSNSRKKEKERPKYYTADPELLLSFVYFDQTYCGYILAKDIEDLFYTIGLNLSRAQIKKIVSKVITDSLQYRKLTDKPKEDINSNDNVNLNIQDISEGNKTLLPVFKNDSSQFNIMDELSTTFKRQYADDKKSGSSLSATIPKDCNGMVSYKGSLIDVEKLLEQIKRFENAREDTEKLLVDLRKNNTELLSNVMRSKDKIKDLQSDVKSYNRKLSESEQSLSNHMKKTTEYYSVLSHIYDKVAPIFTKSEKISKKELCREKDKERDKKDKLRPAHASGVGGNDKEKDSKEIVDKDKEVTKDGIKKELKVEKEK